LTAAAKAEREGRLEDALDALASAESCGAPPERVSTARMRVRSQLDDVNAVREGMAKAEQLEREEKFDEALSALSEIAPVAERRGRLAALQEAKARVESNRRKRDTFKLVQPVLAEAKKCLEDGNVEAAREMIARARELAPGEPAVLRLDRRVTKVVAAPAGMVYVEVDAAAEAGVYVRRRPVTNSEFRAWLAKLPADERPTGAWSSGKTDEPAKGMSLKVARAFAEACEARLPLEAEREAITAALRDATGVGRVDEHGVFADGFQLVMDGPVSPQFVQAPSSGPPARGERPAPTHSDTNSAWKYDEKEVNQAFTTRDKTALRRLIDRWRKAPTDSDFFGKLSADLGQFAMDDAGLLEEFEKVLASTTAEDARRTSAGDILRWQMATDDPSTEIVKNWKSLKAEFVRRTQHPRPTGTDLFAVPGWRKESSRPLGLNERIDRKGSLLLTEAIPESIQTGSFTLSFRMLLLEGDGPGLILGSEQGEWWPTLTNGEWRVTTGARIEFHITAPRAAGWTQVTFEVTDQSTPRTRFERAITIHVDGQLLLNTARLDGRIKVIGVSAGDAVVVLGGAEVTRPK
jgi:hypothetical protein